MASGMESEIEELQPTDAASCRQSTMKGKGMKRESAVWKYFQRIQSSDESCVECKECRKTVKMQKENTTNLKRST